MAIVIGAAAVLGVEWWVFTRKLQPRKPKITRLAGRFVIRRAAGGNAWVLHGTGRDDCDLRFASWNEAIKAAAELKERLP